MHANKWMKTGGPGLRGNRQLEVGVHCDMPESLFLSSRREYSFLETFKLVWCLIRKVDTRMRNVESI